MNVLETASALDRAERMAVPLTPAPGAPSLSAGEAWAVADARDQLRRERGARAVGYKLGWTSEVMRSEYGISDSNHGRLFDYMDLGGAAVLDLTDLISPLVEPEIAFRARHQLGQGASAEDIRHGGDWAIALEVVDPRWRRPFTWVENTADGSSAARFLTGPWLSPVGDPADWAVHMTWTGGRLAGTGANALGSPVAAVAWLLDSLARTGDCLQPGAVVLTGGLTVPVALAPGVTVEATSDQLGRCEINVIREAERA